MTKRLLRQARLAVCLLFLYICCALTSCVPGEDAETLDVWFFSCSDDADSILLQTKSANIMIDTGLKEDSGELLDKLDQLGVERIDLLILTHPDKDHIGGVAAILDACPVTEIMQTSCDKGSALQEELDQRLSGENVSMPEETTELSYGELTLTVYPPRRKEYDGSNNYSIAALAEFEGKRFFFAGDAKKKRIEELLAEALPQVDVYKAAYHGRDIGNGGELIALLSPSYAVVTAETAEEETENALLAAGADIFSTYHSDVHFTVSDGILDVE